MKTDIAVIVAIFFIGMFVGAMVWHTWGEMPQVYHEVDTLQVVDTIMSTKTKIVVRHDTAYVVACDTIYIPLPIYVHQYRDKYIEARIQSPYVRKFEYTLKYHPSRAVGIGVTTYQQVYLTLVKSPCMINFYYDYGRGKWGVGLGYLYLF